MEPASQFEWHEGKRKINLQTHGIDFLDALAIWEGPVLEAPSNQTSAWGGAIHCRRAIPGEGHYSNLHVARKDQAFDFRQSSEAL